MPHVRSGELSSNQSLTVPQWSVLELTHHHHHHHHVTCHYWFTAVNVLKLTGSSQWAWRLMMQRNMLTERKVTTCLCVCVLACTAQQQFVPVGLIFMYFILKWFKEQVSVWRLRLGILPVSTCSSRNTQRVVACFLLFNIRVVTNIV